MVRVIAGQSAIPTAGPTGHIQIGIGEGDIIDIAHYAAGPADGEIVIGDVHRGVGNDQTRTAVGTVAQPEFAIAIEGGGRGQHHGAIQDLRGSAAAEGIGDGQGQPAGAQLEQGVVGDAARAGENVAERIVADGQRAGIDVGFEVNSRGAGGAVIESEEGGVHIAGGGEAGLQPVGGGQIPIAVGGPIIEAVPNQAGRGEGGEGLNLGGAQGAAIDTDIGDGALKVFIAAGQIGTDGERFIDHAEAQGGGGLIGIEHAIDIEPDGCAIISHGHPLPLIGGQFGGGIPGAATHAAAGRTKIGGEAQGAIAPDLQRVRLGIRAFAHDAGPVGKTVRPDPGGQGQGVLHVIAH